ncbi:hypothetical protein RRG08_011414 [Elysia crispata]|uniref:Uncharacterized protein n=1 Tax=Elysia crispata TaxID=231223 RepID=A0AAE1AXI6_9GAST|nr:hypothetical protein RRG08_011414 [Elysia crispata]
MLHVCPSERQVAGHQDLVVSRGCVTGWDCNESRFEVGVLMVGEIPECYKRIPLPPQIWDGECRASVGSVVIPDLAQIETTESLNLQQITLGSQMERSSAAPPAVPWWFMPGPEGGARSITNHLLPWCPAQSDPAGR